MRIVHVATDAALQRYLGGVEHAVGTVSRIPTSTLALGGRARRASGTGVGLELAVRSVAFEVVDGTVAEQQVKEVLASETGVGGVTGVVGRRGPLFDHGEPSLLDAQPKTALVEVDAEVSRPSDRRRGRDARFEHGSDCAQDGDDIGHTNVHPPGRAPAQPGRRTARCRVSGRQGEADTSTGAVGMGTDPIVQVAHDGRRGREPVDAGP